VERAGGRRGQRPGRWRGQRDGTRVAKPEACWPVAWERPSVQVCSPMAGTCACPSCAGARWTLADLRSSLGQCAPRRLRALLRRGDEASGHRRASGAGRRAARVGRSLSRAARAARTSTKTCHVKRCAAALGLHRPRRESGSGPAPSAPWGGPDALRVVALEGPLFHPAAHCASPGLVAPKRLLLKVRSGLVFEHLVLAQAVVRTLSSRGSEGSPSERLRSRSRLRPSVDTGRSRAWARSGSVPVLAGQEAPASPFSSVPWLGRPRLVEVLRASSSPQVRG